MLRFQENNITRTHLKIGHLDKTSTKIRLAERLVGIILRVKRKQSGFLYKRRTINSSKAEDKSSWSGNSNAMVETSKLDIYVEDSTTKREVSKVNEKASFKSYHVLNDPGPLADGLKANQLYLKSSIYYEEFSTNLVRNRTLPEGGKHINDLLQELYLKLFSFKEISDLEPSAFKVLIKEIRNLYRRIFKLIRSLIVVPKIFVRDFSPDRTTVHEYLDIVKTRKKARELIHFQTNSKPLAARSQQSFFHYEIHQKSNRTLRAA